MDDDSHEKNSIKNKTRHLRKRIAPIENHLKLKNMKDSITTSTFIVHSNDYGKLEIIKYYLFGFHFWTVINKTESYEIL